MDSHGGGGHRHHEEGSSSRRGKEKVTSSTMPETEMMEFSLVELSLLTRIFLSDDLEFYISNNPNDYLLKIIEDFGNRHINKIFNEEMKSLNIQQIFDEPLFKQTLRKMEKVIKYYKKLANNEDINETYVKKVSPYILNGFSQSEDYRKRFKQVLKEFTGVSLDIANWDVNYQNIIREAERNLQILNNNQLVRLYEELHKQYNVQNSFICWHIINFIINLFESFIKSYNANFIYYDNLIYEYYLTQKHYYTESKIVELEIKADKLKKTLDERFFKFNKKSFKNEHSIKMDKNEDYVKYLFLVDVEDSY